MAQTDSGPATGSASYFFGVPQTATVEFHAPLGANSLSPLEAPNVSLRNSSNVQTQVVKNNFIPGVGLKFCNPS